MLDSMSAAPAETLSVEQLASRVGMTVRTVRFYAGRGLIPPPRREGRNGYYGPDHLARLELVRELQAHGFTLSAIEGYLENIPGDATPSRWRSTARCSHRGCRICPRPSPDPSCSSAPGASCSDDDLELLVALGVIEPTPVEDVFQVAPAHLAVGVQFLDVGLPTEAALAARRIITEHGQAMATELTELFRTTVWPHLKSSGQPPEAITTMIERFKPLTIAALVTAYETAVDEAKRETIRRRS